MARILRGKVIHGEKYCLHFLTSGATAHHHVLAKITAFRAKIITVLLGISSSTSAEFDLHCA